MKRKFEKELSIANNKLFVAKHSRAHGTIWDKPHLGSREMYIWLI
jgi:hypothetical protein